MIACEVEIVGWDIEADGEDEGKSEAWLNAEAKFEGCLDEAAEVRNGFLLL